MTIVPRDVEGMDQIPQADAAGLGTALVYLGCYNKIP